MNKGLLALMSIFLLGAPALAKEKKKEHKEKQEMMVDNHSSKPEKKKGLVDQASGQGYGMAGCGLGSILFGEKEGMVQIFAATFNGTAGNQTFGMTSGTLNCDSYKDVAGIQFIETNRYTLENDVVRGGGETLDSLTQLMGCKADASTLQPHYSEIFNGVKDSRKIYFSLRQNLNCEG